MAYKLMKRIITRGGYDKDSALERLDAFLAVGRMTAEEYKELVDLIEKEEA